MITSPKRSGKPAWNFRQSTGNVIDFVLDVYDNCEECRNARKMMALMDTEFRNEGGERYLYGLFPNGPVSQIHDLAGMEAMSSQQDFGFGTSY